MTETPLSHRLQPLDVFRGLFALAIVIYHTTLRYPRYILGLDMPDVAVIPGIMNLEDFSDPVVYCFFMLSGFVISWTVDRCQTPMDFIVSRVSRIYPAYWATIAMVVALRLLWPITRDPVVPEDVLLNLTMLQGYLGAPDVTGVFWSLAVEILFYLYVLTLFTAGLWPRIHLVAFTWSLLLLAFPILAQTTTPVPWRVGRLLLLHYGAFLAAGMMLYRLWRGQTPRWSAVTLAICALAVAIGFRPMPAATCFAFAGVIAWIARGGLRVIAIRPLLWLGGISYALYLSHEMASYTLMRAMEDAGAPRWACVPAAIAMALLLATAITYGIERPAMRAIRIGWPGRPPRTAV